MGVMISENNIMLSVNIQVIQVSVARLVTCCKYFDDERCAESLYRHPCIAHVTQRENLTLQLSFAVVRF